MSICECPSSRRRCRGLVSRIEETWNFTVVGDETYVVRRFKLYPRRSWARPIVWLISLLLRRAIRRHLRDMSHPRDP